MSKYSRSQFSWNLHSSGRRDRQWAETWNTLIKVFINEKTTEMLTIRERDSEVGRKEVLTAERAGEFLLYTDGQGWPLISLAAESWRKGGCKSLRYLGEDLQLMWKEQQIQRPWDADGIGLMKDKQPGRQVARAWTSTRVTETRSERWQLEWVTRKDKSLYIIMKHLVFTLNKLGRFWAKGWHDMMRNRF